MKYEVYSSRKNLLLRKQWRWKFIASNGKVIAVSSEGYNNFIDCVAGMNLVRASASAPQHYTEGYTSRST
jgi:uncharacterized protein YegP (UPF0339 family)